MNENDIISTVEATAPETFKIVINTCFGGFGLSDEAIAMFRERKGITADERATYADEIARDDADLIAVVEALGTEKAGDDRYAELKVVEIPEDVVWEIAEYDGMEHVAEVHRTWC
jgi:hypothetical protein